MDGSTTFKPLRESGATWKEIADELGLDPRTVKKYIDGPARPPSAPRRIGTQPRLIEHLARGWPPTSRCGPR
jgi:predicted transcriptional regulator